MNPRALTLLLCVAGLAGCRPYEPPPVTADHPASPEAPAAPLTPAPSTLAIDEANLPSMPAELQMHSHGQAGMEMTAPAPTSESVPKAPSSEPAQAIYTCPMHPEVVSDQPGTCPKCGMELVPRETHIHE